MQGSRRDNEQLPDNVRKLPSDSHLRMAAVIAENAEVIPKLGPRLTNDERVRIQERVRKIVNDNYDGNQSEFSRKLMELTGFGSQSTVNQVLMSGKMGTDFIAALAQYIGGGVTPYELRTGIRIAGPYEELEVGSMGLPARGRVLDRFSGMLPDDVVTEVRAIPAEGNVVGWTESDWFFEISSAFSRFIHRNPQWKSRNVVTEPPTVSMSKRLQR